MTQDAEATQKQRILEAIETAQGEALAYRRLTKTAPDFLHDGIAEEIRGDMLASARVFPDRFTMIKALIHGGAGAELGVRRGDFAHFMLDNLAPDSLDLFDLRKGRIKTELLDDPRTKLHLGDSSTMLAQCDDRSFDWIYIDGDHSMDGVRKDAEVACRKIKNGGILMFDDYTLWSPTEVMPYGVVHVVNALVNQGHPVIGLALSSHGHYNIALRYSGA